jgi:hypothetical protein
MEVIVELQKVTLFQIFKYIQKFNMNARRSC